MASKRNSGSTAPRAGDDLRAELRAQLTRERAELETRLLDLAADRADVADDAISTPGAAPIDQAVIEVESSRLEAQFHRVLTAVNAALERLDDEEFGRCSNCGRAIPAERLRAVPETTRCVACQSRVARAPR